MIADQLKTAQAMAVSFNHDSDVAGGIADPTGQTIFLAS